MNIVEMPIGDIIPYENNPRNNAPAVRAVAESIKQFGFQVPIVIDKNNVIVAGHTGTYLKSFFSVMYAPSCVRLQMLGSNHKRIHHKVLWENCCPKIISEKYRKGEVSGQEKQV